MDDDEARELLRNHVRWSGAVDDAIGLVLARLDTLDRRAQQVRGGLKPYARPVEIVDYLMGEQP